MLSASIMAANMWKNSLKNVESDNNKILYETLLDFFLQRNGTYFLNKPHIFILVACCRFLEPNRSFTLRMDSDVHDGFISASYSSTSKLQQSDWSLRVMTPWKPVAIHQSRGTLHHNLQSWRWRQSVVPQHTQSSTQPPSYSLDTQC